MDPLHGLPGHESVPFNGRGKLTGLELLELYRRRGPAGGSDRLLTSINQLMAWAFSDAAAKVWMTNQMEQEIEPLLNQMLAVAMAPYATIGLLASYALLNSPGFVGVPTAPTAPPGTDTTQLATTAFVAQAIADVYENLIDSVDGILTESGDYIETENGDVLTEET
ncbi:MAG: hypothetical protein WCA89_12225 [Terracidiphilus sp.]